MFRLSAPTWLLGFASLMVPVLLHLWSRRPIQVVRLGSLEHLAGTPGAHAWGRRLDQVPLLVIRAALLAAVSLALAGPRVARSTGAPPSAPETVVLADPALVADSVAFFSDPLVDSLRRSGTPIRLLEAGFPTLGVESGSELPAPAGLWSLLADLDQRLPAGSTILVVATPRAGALGAARPSLRSAVHWHAIADPATAERVSAEWGGMADSVVRLIESRSPSATARRLMVESADPGTGVARRPSRPRPQSAPALTDRSAFFGALHVVVGARDTVRGGIVATAAQVALAAAQGQAPSAVVSGGSEFRVDGSARPLVFWLNGQSVSDEVRRTVESGGWVIEFLPPDSGFAPTEFSALPGGSNPLGVERAPWLSPLPNGTPGTTVWTDVAGQPVLSVTTEGVGRWYRLGWRPPSPAALAATPALPELLHALVATDRPALSATVGIRQATPAQLGLGASRPANEQDLTGPLFWLASVLLVGERLLSHFHRRQGDR